MTLLSSSRSPSESMPPDAASPDDLATKLIKCEAEVKYLRRELDVLTYAVSHDLRAPLRSLNGFSRILVEQHAGKLDGDALECVATIRAAAQRMAQLLEGVTELSRLAHVELARRPTDLSGLAEHIAAELRASDPTRSVVFALAPDLQASIDPKLARLVLRQLLGNAWKFTARQPAARIEFAATAAADGPAFVVRDNGVGFDAQYAHKLFRPFQRLHTHEEFPGNGIGLALVERIVRHHGGRVWAESAPAQGASFFFSLPPS